MVSCAPIPANDPFIGNIPANDPFIDNIPANDPFIDNIPANDIPIDNSPQNTSFHRNNAQKFLEITELGSIAISELNLNSLFKSLNKEQKIFIAKVDNLSLGEKINNLDQWNIAFENGLIKGLLEKKFQIAEKLDHVNIRNSDEFLGTNPEQAFYMHPIDLKSHKTIINDYDSPYLFEYQVIEFSKELSTIIVYVRIIDLNTLKIMVSSLVKAGNNIEEVMNPDIKLYDKIYSKISSYTFPNKLFDKLSSAAILDIDILNISGDYRLGPSKKLKLIENAIISGILDNSAYNKYSLNEKTSGFNLKFPSVYENIIFNTNPIVYEEWDEFISNTNSQELVMYRYIENEGIYFRIISAKENGNIIGSFIVPIDFKAAPIKNYPVFDIFKKVKSKMIQSVSYELIKNKKIMLIDGDKHSVESGLYKENFKKYNEMQFAIEEGILSSILSKSSTYNIDIKEKLKTLYLKRPWMYENKVFNLNPLYLDNWSQLKGFGVDAILVYNNLIPYHNISKSSNDNYEMAIAYRIIDLNTGNIIQVGEISN